MIFIDLQEEDLEPELEKASNYVVSKVRVDAFLHELTTLCEKYDIYIKGCGCCGSPWLEDFKTGKQYDNLTITEKGYETDD